MLKKTGRNKKVAVKKSALRFRETGWTAPSPVVSKFSEYDSFSDAHCPWALASVYNLHASYRAGELLNTEISEQEANKRATIATNKSIEPLRELIVKDRHTLPTMPKRKTTVARSEKVSHTRALLQTSKIDETNKKGYLFATQNSRTVTPKISSRPNSRSKNNQTLDPNPINPELRTTNTTTLRSNFSTMTDELKKSSRVLNISWQESKTSEAEVACLHTVIRRESLLRDLHEAINIPMDFFQGGDDDDDMNSVEQVNKLVAGLSDINADSIAPNSVIRGLLSLIREAGLECVEAIIKWRNVCIEEDLASNSDVGLKHGQRTFMYHDMNYLLKMVGDLDFISLVPHVSEVILKGKDLLNRNKNRSNNQRVANIQFNIGKEIEPNGNPFLSNIDPLVNRSFALERPCTEEEREASEMENDPLGVGYSILRMREAEGTLLREVKQANIEAEREASFLDLLQATQMKQEIVPHQEVDTVEKEDHKDPVVPYERPWSATGRLTPRKVTQSRIVQTKRDIHELAQTIAEGETELKSSENKYNDLKLSIDGINLRLKELSSNSAGSNRPATSGDTGRKLRTLPSNEISKSMRSLGARKEFFISKLRGSESEVRKLRNALCLDKLELRRLRRLQKSHENKLNEYQSRKDLKKCPDK